MAKSLQGGCLLWFILAIGIRIPETIARWRREWREHLRIANRYFLLYAGGMALVVAILSAIYLGLEAAGLISAGLADALEGAAGAGGGVSELRSLLGSSVVRFAMSVLVACGIAPIIEEVFFRRFLFVALRKRMAFVWALLLTTITFMSVHTNPALGAIGGIYLGYVYEKGKSLPANILVHACVNSVVTFLAVFSRA